MSEERIYTSTALSMSTGQRQAAHQSAVPNDSAEVAKSVSHLYSCVDIHAVVVRVRSSELLPSERNMKLRLLSGALVKPRVLVC